MAGGKDVKSTPVVYKKNYLQVPVTLVFIFSIIVTTSKTYEKYCLYHAIPTKDEQVNFLRSLEYNKYLDLMFWNSPIIENKPVQIMVNRNQEKEFLEKADHFNIKTTHLLENVQKVFDEQVMKEDAFNPYKNKWEYFHTLDDVYKFLNESAVNYSDIARLESIGKSAEGRDILAFSIKNMRRLESNKVIMEAGAHGNEWLGTMFVIYFIDQLLRSEYAPLTEIKHKYNWYFIPILNPDGYDYSQQKDRFWRKNRRIISANSTGVDINRNFKYKFGSHDTTSDPNSDRYHGPHDFSEPESIALRDFIERKRDGLMFYFSLHGYGQKMILPFSDSVKHGGNYHEMQTFAKQAVARIYKSSGRKYKIGNAFEVLGKKLSGDSASWVKKTYRVPYVYTILLRDDDYLGHAIPNDQILPACVDMKVGLTELMSVTPRYLMLGTSQLSSTAAIVKSCEMFICVLVFIVP